MGQKSTTLKTEDALEKELFIEAFESLNVDVNRFKRLSEKSNFSQTPKKLLLAFYYYKKKKKDEFFLLLKSWELKDDFYEGVRLYLLGLGNNHFGKFNFAIEQLRGASEKFEALGNKMFCANCWIILIVTHFNRYEHEELETYWLKLKKHQSKTDIGKLSKYQCEILYLFSAQKFSDAGKLAGEALDSSLNGLHLFEGEFLRILFTINLIQGNFNYCENVLAKYKASNGFVVKTNSIYMSKMLDHFTKDAPLYVYPRDFEDCMELYHQVFVVKALAEGDVVQAKSFWALLEKHNPHLYTMDFTFNGHKCLFSMALEKHLHKVEESYLDLEVLKTFSSPLDKLTYVFSNCNKPLDKFELVTLIWNEEVSEVSLSRLRKLITRFRRQTGIEVKSVQNTYQIKKTA